MGYPYLDQTYLAQRKKLDKLAALLDRIKGLSDLGAIRTMHIEIVSLIKAAQQFALYTRELPARLCDPDSAAHCASALQDAFDIRVEVTGKGWVRVTMPPLLISDDKFSPWFIREPLDHALSDYFLALQREQGGQPFRIGEAVIIFNHRFDRNRPERRRRDLDNIEKNAIQDSIAMYVMTDDDARHCHIFSCVEAGDREETEVYVVPQSAFAEWLALCYDPVKRQPA